MVETGPLAAILMARQLAGAATFHFGARAPRRRALATRVMFT
jgi:hypothetical protein